MGTQRRWRLGRGPWHRRRARALDRALEEWRRDYHEAREEAFARLPALTLASYLHAVAMWGSEAHTVLLHIHSRALDDLDALRLVCLGSGLLQRTTPATLTLTARGRAVLAVLDDPQHAPPHRAATPPAHPGRG